jgi:ABC-type sugar transport system substrate-binding protein
MTMHWRTVALTALLLGTLSSGAWAQQKTIGVLLKNVSNPFWDAAEQGAKDGAKAAGVDVYVLSAQSDADVGPQLDICNTMLERKTDALVVAAVNPTGLLPCLLQATKRGIPILDIDSNLVQDVAEKAGVKVANSIGSDNVQAGAEGAKYMTTKIQKGKVLLLEGAPGTLTAIDRAAGFKGELPKVAPGLQIVASLTGNWERDKAANVTNDVLTANPDLAAIFASNDQMGLGARRAPQAGQIW